jgi:hypothetical protein
MTSPSIITDEMVEKAVHAYQIGFNKPDALCVRAAIEAIAPDIIEMCAVELERHWGASRGAPYAVPVRTLKSQLA